MKFSNKVLSQTITQLCLAKEIDRIVISPGSRNAPLTIGFTEHPGFSCFSIVDERCAAFFALGMAQQKKKPVALVCTSGSALLNYYPALAEAFYSNIPLVVISADRPAHLIEVGDGQTIRQEDVYKNHILYSANCKEGTEHQVYNETEINIALNSAIELQGPVHINAPFSEPLYETQDDLSVRPQHVPARTDVPQIDYDLSEFQQRWNQSARKMILVGTLDPNSLDGEIVRMLAEDKNLVVLTETTSNLHHKNFFPAIDQLIAPLDEEGFKALQPEILLTFGGMVVSKKIKAFLREYSPEVHWHVDPNRAYDTYFCLNHHFKTTPNTFFKKFLNTSEAYKEDYRSKWLNIRDYRRRRQQLFEETVPYSDFSVFSEVCKQLKGNIQLQLSNSATIRYSQLFSLDPGLKVYCNRGTSGIDGSTSTAIGAALASETNTVFVTGDLGFLYDSNALWNRYIPMNFKIIVINNSGGGIFRILPGAKETKHFTTFFETTHRMTAEHLCAMHSLSYASIMYPHDLQQQLSAFLSASGGPSLLEIFTPPEENDEVLRSYFEFLK